jgi:hypothetical protein
MFEQKSTESRSYTDLLKLIQTRGFDQQNNQVNEFIANMKKDLMEEEAQHDDLHATQVQQCAEEEEFRTNEISEGRRSRAASRVHRDLCESEMNEAAALQQIAESSLAINQNLLDELIRERNDQIAEYKNRKQQLATITKVFGEVIHMLDEFAAAASAPVPQAQAAFIQKVNILLAMSIRFNKYEQVMPIYNSYMQMATNADNNFSVEDVAAVRQQIVDLQNNYNTAEADLDSEEATNLANFQKQKAFYEELIAGYINQRDRASAYGKRMQACFEQESDIFKMADSKVQNNKALREHERQICQADQEKYTAVKNAIARELRLLTQLEYALRQLGTQYADKVLPKVGDIMEVTETGDDNDGIDDTYDNADTGGLGN